MIQTAKNQVFGHFLEFHSSDRLEIAYFHFAKQSLQLGGHIARAGSFKNHKNAFLDDPMSKKFVFGHFLEFRASDLLEIAYFDFTK